MIENAVSSVFNKNVVLTSAEETSIRVTDEEIDLKLPASASELKKNVTNVSCVETNVSAIKEFRCQWRCLNCRRDIDWNSPNEGLYAVSGSSDDGEIALLTCPFCSTISKASVTKVKNECKILLSTNNQWFTAGTGVSIFFISLTACQECARLSLLSADQCIRQFCFFDKLSIFTCITVSVYRFPG